MTARTPSITNCTASAARMTPSNRDNTTLPVVPSQLAMRDALWEALPASRRGGYAETSNALLPQLLPALKSGDTVLVKGSNGARMSVIVDALKAKNAGAAA